MAENSGGNRRIGDAGGNLVEAGIKLVGDAFASAFSGGTRTPNARQARALEAAGYELQALDPRTRQPIDPPKQGKWIPVWANTATGAVLSQPQARRLGRQLLRNPPPPPPAGGGGPSPADRPLPATSVPWWGFPIALPGSLIQTVPPWLRALGRRNLPLAIAAWFLQPLEAGRGSDLRDLYNKAKPKTRPGTRRRRRSRTRTRTPPRVRPVALPGPQAIPRPGRRARPVPVAVPGSQVQTGIARAPGRGPAMPPAPKSLPRVRVTGRTIPRGVAAPSIPKSAVSFPASVPSWVKNLATFAAPILLPSLLSRSQAATSARPLPIPATVPLTQPQTAALPYAAAIPRTDACAQQRARERRNRKKACRNPVVRTRKSTKGSKRFVTITRELKCPPSSRKRLPSPLAR